MVDEEIFMMRVLALLAVALFAGALTSAPVAAPAQAQDMSKPTKEERAATRAAKREKRGECSRKADAQNLHLVKRYRFVRNCLKST
jgi:hypothetical protein